MLTWIGILILVVVVLVLSVLFFSKNPDDLKKANTGLKESRTWIKGWFKK